MPRPPTPRQRARTQMVADIKAVALQEMAVAGPAGLSLRAVSRELGMVSSALYRYFPSRDHLLTALIVDAYDDLADAMGAADGPLPRPAHRDRWFIACTTMRDWSIAEPHRFALLYGTPVADYQAPTDTIAPAERVMTAFTSIIQDAAVAGRLTDPPPIVDDDLDVQLAAVAVVLGPEIPAAVLARTIGAIAQIIGMITLELGGHFVGGFEPADRLFAQSVVDLAESIGI